MNGKKRDLIDMVLISGYRMDHADEPLSTEPSMERFAATFEAKVENLDQIRAFFVGCLDRWKSLCAVAPDEDLLVLGFTEAVVNVMDHAYLRETSRPLEIVCVLHLKRLEVLLTHFGRWFEPKASPPPPPTDLVDRGMGLFLIATAFNEVVYARPGSDRPWIRLVKRMDLGTQDSRST